MHQNSVLEVLHTGGITLRNATRLVSRFGAVIIQNSSVASHCTCDTKRAIFCHDSFDFRLSNIPRFHPRLGNYIFHTFPSTFSSTSYKNLCAQLNFFAGRKILCRLTGKLLIKIICIYVSGGNPRINCTLAVISIKLLQLFARGLLKATHDFNLFSIVTDVQYRREVNDTDAFARFQELNNTGCI